MANEFRFQSICILLVGLGGIAFVPRAVSAPGRTVGIGVGVGVPSLVTAEGQVQVSEQWQVGFGYGLLPSALGFLTSSVHVNSQTVTLSTGNTFSVTPQITTNFAMYSPFVRFFPLPPRNFYIQFTYTLLQVTMNVSGALKDQMSGLSVGAFITGNVSVLQGVPTLSLGHLFAGKLFFCNFTLGFSVFGPSSTNFGLSDLIPDLLGGQAQNQAVVDQLNRTIQSEVTTAVGTFRDKYPIVPSFLISVGIFL